MPLLIHHLVAADEPAVVAQNAWAGVCETLATTARGTLRSVELDDRWFPDSSLSASSCAALARIEGLVKGPVVAGSKPIYTSLAITGSI